MDLFEYLNADTMTLFRKPFASHRHLLLVVTCLSVITACAPRVWQRDRDAGVSPETVRALKSFKSAQRFVGQQAYRKALEVYADYLETYPRGPLRDKALLEIGLIHMAMEEYGPAQQTFQRLLALHKRSPLTSEARYQLGLAHYKNEEYGAAIKAVGNALMHAKNNDQRFRLYNLLGYAYSAAQEFRKAVVSYMKALSVSPSDRQPEILNRVREAAGFLDTGELDELIDMFGEQSAGGHLRLQLAKRYASINDIESALQVLADFFRRHPDHEARSDALELGEELKSRSLVDRFLVGCILPLSGPYAVFGRRVLTGVELAVDLFNAQVHTHPVQLVVKDSEGDPTEAVAALKALALNEGAVGIVGPMITSESVALEAQALKIPIITLTQKPEITAVGDYVFRNFLTLSAQVETICDYSVNGLGLKRFAILYPNEPYGVSFMNRFWDELMDLGAEVVGIETYAPEQTDFNEQIRKLVGLFYPRPEPEEMAWTPEESEMWNALSALRWTELEATTLREPDRDGEKTVFDEAEDGKGEDEAPEPIVDFQAVFIPDSPGKVGLIAPQLLYHGVEDVLLLGTNLWHSPKLIHIAHEYVQGAIIPEGFFADSALPQVVDFVKVYENVFGTTPGYLEAQAFDTAWMICEATNIPGVESRMALKMALSGISPFSGVTGVTVFDETGEVEKRAYLLKIEGRRFIQIRP